MIILSVRKPSNRLFTLQNTHAQYTSNTSKIFIRCQEETLVLWMIPITINLTEIRPHYTQLKINYFRDKTPSEVAIILAVPL